MSPGIFDTYKTCCNISGRADKWCMIHIYQNVALNTRYMASADGWGSGKAGWGGEGIIDIYKMCCYIQEMSGVR